MDVETVFQNTKEQSHGKLIASWERSYQVEQAIGKMSVQAAHERRQGSGTWLEHSSSENVPILALIHYVIVVVKIGYSFPYNEFLTRTQNYAIKHFDSLHDLQT